MHPYRTHTCGELRKDDVGKEVRLSGWVHRKRDHGGVIFIDLRDRYGLTQVVFKPERAELMEKARDLKQEYVIAARGRAALPAAAWAWRWCAPSWSATGGRWVCAAARGRGLCLRFGCRCGEM